MKRETMQKIEKLGNWVETGLTQFTGYNALFHKGFANWVGL